MDKLSDLRVKIDQVDDQILALLFQRAKFVKQVGSFKQKSEGVYFRSEREAQIMKRLLTINESEKSPLSRKAVYAIFRAIIASCLAMEEAQTIAYLGPNGTFSHQAVLSYFGESVHQAPQNSIESVFEEVNSGRVNYGIVPVENSYEGAVRRTLDCFLKYPLLKVSLEIILNIEHHLIAVGNSSLEDVHTIYSHEQSLGQCREWLGTHPNIKNIPVESNAYAAQKAAEKGVGYAAIASKEAAELYGLISLIKSIQDSSNNQTRFLAIGKHCAKPSGQDGTALILASDNKPGSLFKLLKPFHDAGINLTSIVSRPSHQTSWDYVFYIEIQGHHESPVVSETLEKVASGCTMLSVLGSFPKAPIL